VFEDEAGDPAPPQARTWARRGHTPVVRVSGKGSGRISVAGLLAFHPGQRPHLYYLFGAPRPAWGRRSLSEADYAVLLPAAHRQLRAPIVLIWDNLPHVSKRSNRCGPHLKGSIANNAVTTVDDLAALVTNGCDGCSTARTCSTGSSDRPDSSSDPDRRDQHRPRPLRPL